MTIKASSPGKAKAMSGLELREMFSVATIWLEKNAATVDALNVFPVPDGDTGTNMLLTMKSAMDEASRVSQDTVSEVAHALAKGGLMGARGNSGVILSQILKGISLGLDDLENFGPRDFACALEEATTLSYKAVSKPKEGTMLTVMKDVAAAAVESPSADLPGMMKTICHEAHVSVERTPELLDVLKEAGVVDAGGQGLYIMFEGMFGYLRGEPDNIKILASEITPASLPPALRAARKKHEDRRVYGYCTEFIIKSEKANPDRIRRRLEPRGDSLLVVGDATTIKVHIHTADPGAVLRIGSSAGSLHDLKIQNMDDQHEEFVQMRRSLAVSVKIATVAVASGPGLEDVFRSLGATAIIPGGQTMNPSTEELLRAIEFVPSDKVIILPNNKNVILTARQAATLTKKTVQVLPTRSMPQGAAALLAFNQEVELQRNSFEMEKAMRRVKSIEITTAIRGVKLGKINILKDQYVGLVDGDLKTGGDEMERVVVKALAEAGVGGAELLTIYFGADIKAEEADALVEYLRRRHPNLQIEVVNGGQPHYFYIMSLE